MRGAFPREGKQARAVYSLINQPPTAGEGVFLAQPQKGGSWPGSWLERHRIHPEVACLIPDLGTDQGNLYPSI